VAALGGGPPLPPPPAATIQPIEDDELGVRLLADIREVFAGEQMHSAPLVAALAGKEGTPWGEVNRGHALTAVKLGSMLREFDIRPEQIKIGGVNRNGYRRAAFEAAWEAYFPPMTVLIPHLITETASFHLSTKPPQVSTRLLNPRKARKMGTTPTFRVSTRVRAGIRR
jgi:Protein of unknown function (DUF3631)